MAVTYVMKIATSHTHERNGLIQFAIIAIKDTTLYQLNVDGR